MRARDIGLSDVIGKAVGSSIEALEWCKLENRVRFAMHTPRHHQSVEIG